MRILKRANETVVGVYEKSRNFGFVIPDNPKLSTDIFIPQGCDAGAVTGHKVTVRIREFPAERGKKPEGVVTGLLGHMDDPGVDILSIVKGFDIPMEVSEKVMKQPNRIKLEVS